MVQAAVIDFFFIREKRILCRVKKLRDHIGRQTDEQHAAFFVIIFHVTQITVDQAAGTGGIVIFFSFDFLNDISFQYKYKLKKVMEVRRVFGIGVIFL